MPDRARMVLDGVVPEFLRRNLRLKLLSVALAVAAWAYLRFAANPVFAARFDQELSVPITLLGVPAGEIARSTERQAIVSIVTPRGASTAIKPDDVKAVVDLAGRGPGVYNVPVQVIAPRLEIASLSPASVTLALERIEERAVPVAIDYVVRGGAAPASAGRIVVQRVAVRPERVRIQGPADDLARVAAVRVVVPLDGAGAFDAMVKPEPVDARGAAVDGVAISPSLVRVSATFIRTASAAPASWARTTAAARTPTGASAEPRR